MICPICGTFEPTNGTRTTCLGVRGGDKAKRKPLPQSESGATARVVRGNASSMMIRTLRITSFRQLKCVYTIDLGTCMACRNFELTSTHATDLRMWGADKVKLKPLPLPGPTSKGVTLTATTQAPAPIPSPIDARVAPEPRGSYLRQLAAGRPLQGPHYHLEGGKNCRGRRRKHNRRQKNQLQSQPRSHPAPDDAKLDRDKTWLERASSLIVGSNNNENCTSQKRGDGASPLSDTAVVAGLGALDIDEGELKDQPLLPLHPHPG